MMEDDRDYYLRRAETQQRLADIATDLGISRAHQTLAELHRQRASELPAAAIVPLFASPR